MENKDSVWACMLDGMSMMFAWVPKISFESKSLDEVQAELNERLGDPYTRDRDALASDWQAVGGDMRVALNKFGIK